MTNINVNSASIKIRRIGETGYHSRPKTSLRVSVRYELASPSADTTARSRERTGLAIWHTWFESMVRHHFLPSCTTNTVYVKQAQAIPSSESRCAGETVSRQTNKSRMERVEDGETAITGKDQALVVASRQGLTISSQERRVLSVMRELVFRSSRFKFVAHHTFLPSFLYPCTHSTYPLPLLPSFLASPPAVSLSDPNPVLLLGPPCGSAVFAGSG